jgi:hypothetical protein
MERHKAISDEICGNGLDRRGMNFNQAVLVRENRFDDSVDQIVREIVADHGEIEKAHSRVVLAQRWIPAGATTEAAVALGRAELTAQREYAEFCLRDIGHCRRVLPRRPRRVYLALDELSGGIIQSP